MKRPLLFLLLLFIPVNVFSQKIHFCDNDNVWKIYHQSFPPGPLSIWTITNYFNGQVIIKGVAYKHLSNSLNFYVREDTADAKVYYCCRQVDSAEEVLYDYNWKVGDTVHYSSDTACMSKAYYTVASVDSVLINGNWYHVWNMAQLINPSACNVFTFKVIEGLGSTIGPLQCLDAMAFETQNDLICFTSDGNIYPLSKKVGEIDNTNSCTLSIPDVLVSQAASAYPNPVTPLSRIRLPYVMTSGIVQIVNVVGQVIWKRAVTNEKEIWIGDKIEVPGVYYYKITDNDGKLLLGKLNKE